MINKESLQFLKDLKANNHKEWFDVNRDRYETELQKVRDFAEEVLQKVKKFDEIQTPTGRKSLMRIYRDVRFSKDKRPYKHNWGGSFKRAGKHRRGGMYFHIEPGACFVGGGFWAPSPADLKHIRNQIAADPDRLRKIISSKEFKSVFKTLEGEQVKTAPKGFDKEHPAIDLLRYKQFLISQRFTDAEAVRKDFPDRVAETFRAMMPFFNYMSDILTHDLNGTPIPEDKLPG